MHLDRCFINMETLFQGISCIPSIDRANHSLEAMMIS